MVYHSSVIFLAQTSEYFDARKFQAQHLHLFEEEISALTSICEATQNLAIVVLLEVNCSNRKAFVPRILSCARQRLILLVVVLSAQQFGRIQIELTCVH